MEIEEVKSNARIEIYSKQDLFLKLCSLNYLNALVKKEEYKEKIGYGIIKPSVIWTVKTLIKNDLKGLCEELAVNQEDDSVFIRCYGLQFSFHHVNSKMLIQDWPELSNKEAKWDGIRLQPVASHLIENLLMESYRIPDYQAKICVAFSQGKWRRTDFKLPSGK